MIRGVIFDVDGTLVDSVDLHAAAWQEAFRTFGHDLAYEAVRAQIGKGGDQLMPVFLGPEEMERIGEDLDAYRSDLFKRTCMDRVRPFAHVRDLLERVREDGRRVVLASSAKADELAVYKRIAGIEDLVDAQTSSADAERSKPFPDIFQAALDQAGLSAAETVVVGDTPYDAQAARRAGMPAIGMLCGGFAEADLRAASCVAIYRDPEDLWRRVADSLIGRNGAGPPP